MGRPAQDLSYFLEIIAFMKSASFHSFMKRSVRSVRKAWVWLRQTLSLPPEHLSLVQLLDEGNLTQTCLLWQTKRRQSAFYCRSDGKRTSRTVWILTAESPADSSQTHATANKQKRRHHYSSYRWLLNTHPAFFNWQPQSSEECESKFGGFLHFWVKTQKTTL